jgi:hypothetical protein
VAVADVRTGVCRSVGGLCVSCPIARHKHCPMLSRISRSNFSKKARRSSSVMGFPSSDISNIPYLTIVSKRMLVSLFSAYHCACSSGHTWGAEYHRAGQSCRKWDEQGLRIGETGRHEKDSASPYR